jgi:hypothetical protein
LLAFDSDELLWLAVDFFSADKWHEQKAGDGGAAAASSIGSAGFILDLASQSYAVPHEQCGIV